MSEEGTGRIVLVAAGLVVLALLVLVLVVVVGGGPAPEAPPAPRTRVVRAEGARPAPRSVRVPLPAPAGREHPDPSTRQEPARLDADIKREMNHAADDVLSEARSRCLQPWVDDEIEAPTEVVFDFVLHDGELADIGLRSLSREMPADVVSCVADAVWEAEWPGFGQLPGELRLQRSLDLVPVGPAP